MKSHHLLSGITFLAMMLLSLYCTGQPANPNPPGVPIDGGIGALIAAGAAYGVKKRREMKKKKEGSID